MILAIQSLGIILILLAFLHAIFPRYFRWKEDLAELSAINREIMGVHTFFIALMVFLVGVLMLSSADLLTTTLLGRRICVGMSIFWGLRLFCQFFWYSADHWRGRTFESIVHVLFTLLWLLLTGVLAWAAN